MNWLNYTGLNCSDSEESIIYHEYRLTLSDTVILGLGLVGFATNITVFTALLRCKQEQTAKHLFLMSLAMADILCCPAFIVESVTPPAWPIRYPVVHCFYIFTTKLLEVTVVANLLSVLCFATDFYIYVTRPFRYDHIMTKRCSRTMLLGIWLFSCLCVLGSWITIFALQFRAAKRSGVTAFVLCSYYAHDPIHYIIPCLIICVSVLLFLMYCKVGQISSVQRKGVITIALLYLTFCFTWIPFSCHFLFCLHGGVCNMRSWTFCIVQLNSLLDPLIYSVRLSFVRSALKELCSQC